MLDSGSIRTFINKAIAQLLNLYIIPKSRTISLANPKHRATIIGEVVVDITLQGTTHKGVVIEVIDNLFIDLIIGKDLMKRYKRVTFEFDGPNEDLIIGAIPDDTIFPAMSVEPPPLFTHVSPNIKPIASKSRRYSQPDSTFIKEETRRLLQEGIIEPSISPWRAQVLVTKNERHKRRMVVDYSNTINLYTELDAYPMPNISDMVNKISQYKYYSTLDLKSAYHQVPIQEQDKIYTAFETDGKLYQFKRLPFGVTNGVSTFQRTIDKVIENKQLSDTFAFLDNVTICGLTKEEHDSNLKAFYEAARKNNITFNESKSILFATSITLLGYTISHNKISPDRSRLQPLLDMPPPKNLKSQKRVIGMFSYYSKFLQRFSDKIRPLAKNTKFPLSPDALEAFSALKHELTDVALNSIDANQPFVVETDASYFCLAATLNQQQRPVAFFSRTLKRSEYKHHPVEKEAAAIVESLREWRPFLLGKHFTVITDQKAISYMYNTKLKSKIKNDKIARWRIELSQFSFDIVYRPGSENAAPDMFTRIASMQPGLSVKEIHEQLCHPGITRLHHFVKSKNLPFSIEQVKQTTGSCRSCLFLKPKFLKGQGQLITAISPFQRLNIDFKGPLPTSSYGNSYLLTIVDEYSRFPFAYPCKDMTSKSVIKCFDNLFSLFGMPVMVHNDRATDFLSLDTKTYLQKKGIATSKTSRHNPRGNGQVEKLNGTLWKAILVTLHSRNMKASQWEDILPDALHSIRSLLCTSTNMTPHERLFNFPRKSTSGHSIPTWLNGRRIYGGVYTPPFRSFLISDFVL